MEIIQLILFIGLLSVSSFSFIDYRKKQTELFREVHKDFYHIFVFPGLCFSWLMLLISLNFGIT